MNAFGYKIYFSQIICASFIGSAIVATLVWFCHVVDPVVPLFYKSLVSNDNDDDRIVNFLLAENLSERSFDFSKVVETCSGKQVLPLNQSRVHRKVIAVIEQVLQETLIDLNEGSSPVRKLRRINEASAFFEAHILARINKIVGMHCDVPPTRAGRIQRAGYPDLRITDLETGQVFYLDPKLVESGSEESTFRTFYFEPKNKTLKITDDAVHLLIGIEHDGKPQEWRFSGWRLVDLSKLRVRMKAEFQASNADLYNKSMLSSQEFVR